MPVKVEEARDLKTCLITIVEAGLCDKVIKIYPAKHESEKIWLGTRRGDDRWDAVKRLMENFADRTKPVSKPAPLHSDPKQSITPDLKPENYPQVNLENGAVLEAPVPEERFNPLISGAPNVLEVSAKVNKLESHIEALAQGISSLTSAVQDLKTGKTEVKAAKKRGRPAKAAQDIAP